jgi:predicted DNA-binding protein
MNGLPAGPGYRDGFTPNKKGPGHMNHDDDDMPFGSESYDVVIEEMVSQMKGKDKQVVFRMMHDLYERLRILYSDYHLPLFKETKTSVFTEIHTLFPEDSLDYINAMRAYKLVFEGLDETHADHYYKRMLDMHERLLNLERRLLPPNSD